MKVLIPCLVFLVFAQTVLACVNITGTKYNGESVSGSGLIRVRMLRNSLKKDTRPDGTWMEANLRNAKDFNGRSDYSVALIFLGRSREAVELLNRLETEKPGQYFISANLGTAYELSGNNEEALRWIKEAIRRDPDSHNGTEWLHVKILEAKIAQQKDVNYFKKHSVLELEPGKVGSEISVDNKQYDPRQITTAIEFQLTERLKFVKPPDAPVASLLFDYAAIEARTATLESAKEILVLAKEYGYPDNRIQPLVRLYDQRIAWRKTKQYTFYAFLGVVAVSLLYFLYKRGIFVISSRDLKR